MGVELKPDCFSFFFFFLGGGEGGMPTSVMELVGGVSPRENSEFCVFTGGL